MDLKSLEQRVPKLVKPLFIKITRSPLGRRLARGMFWSFVGSVFSRGLALVSGIIVARLLGKEDFGELGIIQSTVMMFATYATFGMGLTAAKHVAEFKKSDPKRAGRIVVLSSIVAFVSGTIVAILIVIAAPLIATEILAAPHLVAYIRISGLALFFTVMNGAQLGTLNGFEAFRRLTVIEATSTIIAIPFTIAATYYFGLTGAVTGMIVLFALRVCLNTLGIRKEAQLAEVSLRWDKLSNELGILWRFSFPSLIAGAVYVPAMWFANVLLVNTSQGYEEMGVFNAADRWRTAIKILPALLGGVSLPILSSLNGEARHAEFRRMMWRNVKIAIGMSLLIAGPIALLAPWIMSTYGAGFREGQWVLVTLCGAATVMAAYGIIGQSFASRGRVWTMFHLNLVWALVLIATMWLLRYNGAQGLAMAYLFAESFRLITGYFLCVSSLRPHNNP